MKQMKYWLKRQCLARWPRGWWALRGLLRGPLEPELKLIEQLCDQNGTFVDVGANWGAFSFEALRLGRAVHSFEPQSSLANVLRKGLGPLGATVHHAAVSDVAGTTELRVPRNDIGYSTIEQTNKLENTANLALGIATEQIKTLKLDDLALAEVSLIKIDVEGHEQAVIAGAVRLLIRDKPSLIVETEDRHSPGTRARVCSFLAAHGYRAFAYRKGKLIPLGDQIGPSPRNLAFVHSQRVATANASLFEQG
jgi:FkbM family methyltransferase